MSATRGLQVRDSSAIAAKFGLVTALVCFVAATVVWFLWSGSIAPYLRERAVPENVFAFELESDYVGPPRREALLNPAELLEQSGQVGDSFGGFNALVGLLTVFLVLGGAWIQWRALQEARNQQMRSRFDDHFFQLLSLLRETSNSFSYFDQRKKTRRTGNAAITAWAVSVVRCRRHYIWKAAAIEELLKIQDWKRATELCQLVFAYMDNGYGRMPSTFGPYMRILYRLYDYIESAPIETSSKEFYAKIASATLPDAGVLLVALNGLTRPGRKLRRVVEKFGLLEHLQPKMRKLFRPALRLGYSPSAFKFRGLDRPIRAGRLASFSFEDAFAGRRHSSGAKLP